jgi:sugar lactone lactonase YvrE
LLFSALLAGCGSGAAPFVDERWRIGMGAAGLSVAPDASTLAVVCRRSNDVWVLDLKTGLAQVRVDTLPKPRAVLFHPDGLTFYVPEGLSSVAQVRLSDRRVARRFRPRSRVGYLAYEPGSQRIFGGHVGLPTVGVYRLKDMHLETSVSVGGEVQAMAFVGNDAWVLTRQADALVRVNLTDMSVKAASATGPEPRSMALDGQGRAFVACRGRQGEASALALPTAEPTEEALSPISATAEGDAEEGDTLTALAADDASMEEADDEPLALDLSALHRFDGGGVAVLRLEDVRKVDYIPVPGGPMALLLSPSGKRLALACEDGFLRMVDLEKRKVMQVLKLNARPGAMVADPDGRHLLLALNDEKAVLRILPGGAW